MHKKLIFVLQQDDDGYPPVTSEGVWVIQNDINQYIVDNIPFFTRDATLGDLVEARDHDGELYFSGTLVRSGNSLIRVVYYQETDPAEMRVQLAQIGCSTELDHIHRLVAVNVPPEVDLCQVQAFLHSGYEQGRWDYEEAILRQ